MSSISLMTRRMVILSATTLLLVATLAAQPLDHTTLAAIREEGLGGSQVMDHISWLSDVYGPRVTGTPAIEQARAWTMERLRAWGLSNVHEERFPFGHGWSLERFSRAYGRAAGHADHRVSEILVVEHRRHSDGRGDTRRHPDGSRLR